MKTIILFLVSIFTGTLVSAQNYEILYTQQINNVDDIFVINDKGETKQITNNRSKDSSPMISPDGNFIVFASERVGWWKIWLMNINKNEFKQLTNSSSAEYSPSWSPDENHIVFISSRSGNSDVFVMSKSGKEIKNLTNSSQDDTTPFWGKDNMIYYSSEINGTFQIIRMLPDGSKKEVLTKDDGDKFMPQVSNGKNKLLYYTDVDGNYEIYTMNIDGTEMKRLTNNPLMDIRPRWSSDDKKIVFERGNKKNNQHIFMMDADGKNIKQLTYKNYNYAASFVPNKIKLID